MGEDLNAVGGCDLDDASGIGRDGLGQSQVVSWFAQGRHELVEAAR